MEYTITVPKPCNEKWDSMTPVEKGMFCSNCKKDVLDFTQKSNYELSKLIDGDANICGRFNPHQLNTTIRSAKNNGVPKTGILFGLVSLLTLATPVMAQTDKQVIENHEFTLGKIAVRPIEPPTESMITIRGTVKDEQGQSLPGAHVVLKNSDLGVQADFDGNFSIEITQHQLLASNVLVISYIGFEVQEYPLHAESCYLNITMKEDYQILGELVIVRKPNVLERVANVFRKKENRTCQ